MTVPGLVLATGLSLLFLVVVFVPLERTFPARRRGFFRPAWLTDFAHLLGQYFVWGGLVLGVLDLVERQVQLIVPAAFRVAVASQPWWLQAIEVVLLSDLFIYWGHRVQHRVGFLWRFHSIHHSAEHLDWMAAYREHPLDTLYTVALINLPTFLLGFPIETLASFLAFRGVWEIYIHSNVRLPLGPFAFLLGSPELHRWHHARERFAGNYSNLSPMMDLLFGTYQAPAHEPESLGIGEPIPKTYLGQLLHPFRRRKARN